MGDNQRVRKKQTPHTEIGGDLTRPQSLKAQESAESVECNGKERKKKPRSMVRIRNKKYLLLRIFCKVFCAMSSPLA